MNPTGNRRPTTSAESPSSVSCSACGHMRHTLRCPAWGDVPGGGECGCRVVTPVTAACNALRLPVVSEKRTNLPVLYPVVEVISEDDVCRVERLECGHTKTTMTASRRPAKRRRCLKCEHGEGR